MRADQLAQDKEIQGAIDAHTKRMCIELLKWIAGKDGDKKLVLIDHCWYLADDTDGDFQFTEEILYEMFIKEISGK